MLVALSGNTAGSTADIIDIIGQLVTGSVTWIQSGVSAIVGSPLLLTMFLFGMVSIGIGLVRRFF